MSQEYIQHIMDNKNKVNFSRIQKTEKYIPSSIERIMSRDDEKKYVKYGDYNDFPSHLIDLYNNSSIHSTCVNAIVDAIIGEGLVSEPSFILDKANPDETWNQIFKKVAKDYKLFGGFAIEVIYNRARDRVAEVYHIDFSWVRSSEKDYRGKTKGYFISDSWDEKSKYYSEVASDDIPYLPCFNFSKAEEEPKQLYVYKPYSSGQKYYPLPDYAGALKVINLDQEVDNFHLNNIMNGLAPSLAITTFTNSDPDQRQDIQNMLVEQYSGTDNAGSLIYMDVDSPENAPQIVPIQQNGADGYYTTINDLVTQKILTAHRITSPMILGIKTSGQLGGRQEVLDAYLLLLNTVIRPYQQNILSVFEELLELKYPNEDVSLGVQQLKLFEDGEEEVDVVTSDEAEIGEDTDLEEQINQ